MASKEIAAKRLRLAALRPEDRAALIALMTDDEVGRTYMVPPLRTEEEKAALFERLRGISLSEGRFFYGIFMENRLIGLIHEVAVQGEEIELGYLISPAEKGKGYASEALAAAVDELFSRGFSTVKAAAFEENAASLRVMEKCGLRRTGETETVEYRGQKRLCLYCAITR